LRRRHGGRGHRDVPPEVTTGWDLVRLGGDTAPGDDPVVVEVCDAEGFCPGTVGDVALAPGCSLATTTPMATVAPAASSAATRVSHRRRASARPLVSGELRRGAELTDLALGTASVHAGSGATRGPQSPRWTTYDPPRVAHDGARRRSGGFDCHPSTVCGFGSRAPFHPTRWTYAGITRVQALSGAAPSSRHVHVIDCG